MYTVDQLSQLTYDQRVTLREGDWSLNVRDEFKGMHRDEIKSALEPKRNNLMFAFHNAIRDFNFSALIRVCNAFACSGVMYSGFRKFDPRGAVGTLHYENVMYHDPTYEDMTNTINYLRTHGYEFVVAESDEYEKSVMLPNFQWKDKTILMLGEESVGVPAEYIDMADRIVCIPMVGSVRSLNVASAGHILAYDYQVKTGRF
jgi:tRNA G18 (ribose-2'-O)-methylase SpoU